MNLQDTYRYGCTEPSRCDPPRPASPERLAGGTVTKPCRLFRATNAALDRIESALARSTATGLDLALEASSISAQLYIDDARLYRQVLVRIPRVLFEGTHLGRDPAAIVVRAMTQAQSAGVLSAAVDSERLGRIIYSNYLGAIYDWACGDASDAVFLATSQVAVLAPAAACATEAVRAELSTRLLEHIGVRTHPGELADAPT